jgi:hypothetical protein
MPHFWVGKGDFLDIIFDTVIKGASRILASALSKSHPEAPLEAWGFLEWLLVIVLIGIVLTVAYQIWDWLRLRKSRARYAEYRARNERP